MMPNTCPSDAKMMPDTCPNDAKNMPNTRLGLQSICMTHLHDKYTVCIEVTSKADDNDDDDDDADDDVYMFQYVLRRHK
jgi:hypothetical protein